MSNIVKRLRKQVMDNLDEFVFKYFTLPDGRPLKLTPYQSEFIKAVLKRNYSKYMYLACTRTGKSEATGVLGVLMGILYPKEEIIVVAPQWSQALEMFERFRRHFMGHPNLWSFVESRNKRKQFKMDRIKLINGTILRCLSGSPLAKEAPLGFGGSAIIVDEAGSIDREVFRTRVLRMVSNVKKNKGVMILLGTTHNIDSFLYDEYVSGDYKKGKNLFVVTWRDGVKAGVLDKKWVEYQRKVMTKEEFEMWFEARFIPTLKGAFDLSRIRQLSTAKKMNKPEPGFTYYAGLDVARMGRDQSALVIVRVPEEADEDTLIEMVNYYTRSNKTLTDIAGWTRNLCEQWDVAALGVEEWGMSYGAHDILKEVFGSRVVGIKMVGSTRTEVYRNLINLVEEGKILLLNDNYFHNQFRSYDIKYTSDGKIRIIKNPEFRDDIVDALAYACYVATSHRRLPQVYVFEELLRGELP